MSLLHLQVYSTPAPANHYKYHSLPTQNCNLFLNFHQFFILIDSNLYQNILHFDMASNRMVRILHHKIHCLRQGRIFRGSIRLCFGKGEVAELAKVLARFAIGAIYSQTICTVDYFL